MATVHSKALSRFLPTSALQQPRGTLFNVLSFLPRDGVGCRVAQSRWEKKGITGSYWEITRVKLKDEGAHGKAWGKLFWKGKPIHERDTLIRQGLKHSWKEISEGESALPR